MKFDALDAGDFHTCGISGDKTYCWGHNEFGQLGEGTTTNRSTPVEVYGGYKFRLISASGATTNFANPGITCGITRTDVTMCWGITASPLGYNSIATPQVVAPGFRFKEISTGGLSVCGVTDQNAGYCWSQALPGTAPAVVAPSIAFATITSGEGHVCGADISGKAYCWGRNGTGEVGDGTMQNQRPSPTAIASNLNFRSFALGMFHSCGLVDGGQALCWGWNLDYQLGDGTIGDSATPHAVATTLRFTQLAAGSAHTCGITATGEAYCWGSNFDGELGMGFWTFDRSKPSRVLLGQ
jgi:alpha-tubulin suppressor-like RCC1 family protein